MATFITFGYTSFKNNTSERSATSDEDLENLDSPVDISTIDNERYVIFFIIQKLFFY